MTDDNQPSLNRLISEEQMRAVAKIRYMFASRNDVTKIFRLHYDDVTGMSEGDISFLNDGQTISKSLDKAFDLPNRDFAVDYHKFEDTVFGILPKLKDIARRANSRNSTAFTSEELAAVTSLVDSFPELLLNQYNELIAKLHFKSEEDTTGKDADNG